MKLLLPLLMLLLAAAVVVPFEVVTISLQEVVRQSEFIVVGEVTAVREAANQPRTAVIAPTETWQGEALESIGFNASSTFDCDISTAHRGERVVLFISRDQAGALRIAHFGRGRMPLRYVDDKPYATYFGGIEFGADASRTHDFLDWDPYRRGIELPELKRLVSEAQRKLREEAASKGAK